MKYPFIQKEKINYPVQVLCRVMRVSTSGYYRWNQAGYGVVSPSFWLLCQRMKELFAESRESMGSRRIAVQLRKEGYKIDRYRARKLMKQLNLYVKRKKRFVLTTDSRHKFPIAENKLNRAFSPLNTNRVWATDITYIWSQQGWVYLAVVIDLYSRRVVGWKISDRMEVSLVSQALIMALNLRMPSSGLLHHSDRGSQYASNEYQQLLRQNGIISSMSRKGNCWDNAPVERFFSSLKREWITGNSYSDRDSLETDVKAYIAYYNAKRLHSTLGGMSPIEFEICT